MTTRAAQQERFTLFRRIAMFLAGLYFEFIYPAKFDEVFYPNDKRVRVTVEEFKTDGDTQPFKALSEIETMDERKD